MGSFSEEVFVEVALQSEAVAEVGSAFDATFRRRLKHETSIAETRDAGQVDADVSRRFLVDAFQASLVLLVAGFCQRISS